MTLMVAFDSVEPAIADWLAAALAARGDSIPVVLETPNPAPDRFVRIERIGGATHNLTTDAPRIVAECHDTVKAAAGDLAKVVRALLDGMAGSYVENTWVDRVQDMGVHYSPDPDTRQPRYLVFKQVLITGEAL